MHSVAIARSRLPACKFCPRVPCQPVECVMSPGLQFYVLVVVSCLVFVGILHYVMRARARSLSIRKVFSVSAVVVVGGMLIARFSAQSGMPWWIYYTVPMLLTVFLPPVVFRMTKQEFLWYIVLAFLSAPSIHIVFSFFFGWRDYMPFLYVPSLWQLVGAA